MRNVATALATSLVVVSALCSAAAAEPLKPGDSINYQYTSVQGAKPDNKATFKDTFTFSVSVDRINADGSVHATISPHYSFHIPGWVFPDFEGTVLSDGEIVPTYDLTVLKGSGLDTGTSVKPGYRPRTPEEQLAMAAYSFNRRVLLFNDVALGAGTHKTFKDGDAWRIVIPDKDNETINFLYVKTESYQGQDVAVLTFSLIRTTSGGPTPVNGTADYDPQRRLLVDLHYEGNNDTPVGVADQTVEISIQQ